MSKSIKGTEQKKIFWPLLPENHRHGIDIHTLHLLQKRRP